MTETNFNEFGAIVTVARAYFPQVYSQADRDELISAASEGWAVGLSRIDTTRTKEEQVAFLFSSARGYVRNWLRERVRRHKGGETILRDGEQEVGSLVNATEVHEDHIARLFMGIQLDRVLGAVEMLPKRERKIIYRRYMDGCTMQEVGDELGVSRERVRQIEKKALDTLRHHFNPEV